MTTLARFLAAALLVLAAAAALPSRADAFTVGIQDQKTGMWQDTRFAQLGIKKVRLLVSYDNVLKGDFSRYDMWMAAAHTRRADVLLTIDRHSKSTRKLPSSSQYRKVVRTLRHRYPWVKTMGAWNEANHHKQPTFRKPKKAAQFYNIMRAECKRCRIVAADVLDQGNMTRWLKTFKRHARKPKIWGLHNYVDSNNFKSRKKSGTARFLKATRRGEVWLTETGGIVKFKPRYKGGKKGEKHAAKAMKHTFKLARMSKRIKRVYLYHWDAEPKFKTWDSGLVAANGRARPALDVVRRELNRGRKASKRIAKLPARSLGVLPLF